MKGRIRSFSGPYFPAFVLNTNARKKKTDQKNNEYGNFSRIACWHDFSPFKKIDMKFHAV